MTEEIRVVPIGYQKAKPWIVKKHYARRCPPIKYSFALLKGNKIQGVVTYGPPCTNQIPKSAIGDKASRVVLELNRLCLHTDIPNAASILVGRSLKMLPLGRMVVSYADSRMGHVGYIYQAVNFLYCGQNVPHDDEYLIDGKWTHSRTLSSRGITAHVKWGRENNIETRKALAKHRYVNFTGSKSDKRKLRKLLKWPIVNEYPKTETKAHYDAGEPLSEAELTYHPPQTQPELFREFEAAEVSRSDTRLSPEAKARFNS